MSMWTDQPYNIGTDFFGGALPGFGGIIQKDTARIMVAVDKQIYWAPKVLGASRPAFFNFQVFDTWLTDFDRGDDIVGEVAAMDQRRLAALAVSARPPSAETGISRMQTISVIGGTGELGGGLALRHVDAFMNSYLPGGGLNWEGLTITSQFGYWSPVSIMLIVGVIFFSMSERERSSSPSFRRAVMASRTATTATNTRSIEYSPSGRMSMACCTLAARSFARASASGVGASEGRGGAVSGSSSTGTDFIATLAPKDRLRVWVRETMLPN